MQKMPQPSVKTIVLWLGLVWAMPVACSLRTDHAADTSAPTVSIRSHTAAVTPHTAQPLNRG